MIQEPMEIFRDFTKDFETCRGVNSKQITKTHRQGGCAQKNSQTGMELGLGGGLGLEPWVEPVQWPI